MPEPELKVEKFEDGPKLSEFTLPCFFDEEEDDWTKNTSRSPKRSKSDPPGRGANGQWTMTKSQIALRTLEGRFGDT